MSDTMDSGPKTYLYMRVSTPKQSVEAQEFELRKRFPDGIVVAETASGVKSRPKLVELLKIARTGDTIAVVALDRFGRRLLGLISLMEECERRGINVISLREGMDYRTPVGRMVIQVLGAAAELERSLISERTKAVHQVLKAKGIKVGPRSSITSDTLDLARYLSDSGHSLRDIEKRTGVSKSHLSVILRASAPSASVA